MFCFRIIFKSIIDPDDLWQGVGQCTGSVPGLGDQSRKRSEEPVLGQCLKINCYSLLPTLGRRKQEVHQSAKTFIYDCKISKSFSRAGKDLLVPPNWYKLLQPDTIQNPFIHCMWFTDGFYIIHVQEMYCRDRGPCPMGDDPESGRLKINIIFYQQGWNPTLVWVSQPANGWGAACPTRNQAGVLPALPVPRLGCC